MTVRAYNKVTRVWAMTEDGHELTPPEQWVLNPTFVPDEATCQRHGAEFWSFNGNVISTVPEAEWRATMLARAQRQKWLEIQDRRERCRQGGVKVGAYWFHTDDTSRIQIIGLLLMGQQLPSNIMWKTMSGAFVPMTPALVQQIFQALLMKELQAFQVGEQHRAQLLQSADPANYDFSAGWPPSYVETTP
jgi:hypothetical protein